MAITLTGQIEVEVVAPHAFLAAVVHPAVVPDFSAVCSLGWRERVIHAVHEGVVGCDTSMSQHESSGA